MADAPIPRDIEAVFAKLLLVYGAAKLNATYRDQAIETVKRHWAHELRGMNASDIAYGLTVLPADFMPNVLQFKAACNRAPVQSVRQLAGPPASPERVQAVLGRMQAATAHLRGCGERDPKAWAWKLLARQEAGERLPSCHLRMAHDALARELAALASAEAAG